ncbi:uncharacterized protein [Diadema setosum]|uniref:uncharacterized protein n=1 Tax=Diadema setosum TaxID=31175 RepID=UPI003B3A3AEE
MASVKPQRTAHVIAERERTSDVLTSENINVDFASMFLCAPVTAGLRKVGFEKPSPIQLKAIPVGRCGLDLIVQAKSGTGKTCVFTVIALESLDLTSNVTQVLVLAPTREIAVQIQENIEAIGCEMEGLRCHVFMGGTLFGPDRQKLKKCHVAVGTPGRIKQLIEYDVLKTESIRLFVLDEADKLLDDTFQEQVNWVYNHLPENKQMLALSATYPEYLAKHLTKYMRDPTFVRLNPKDLALRGIKQLYVEVPDHALPNKAFEIKVEKLLKILAQVSFNQCLIFSNLQIRAQNLCDILCDLGWPSECISGNQEQAQRLSAMAKLKRFQCRILISTDLTARGIDAENVNLIINLDIPEDTKTYLHRIGRAGRFGTHGAAISLACQGREIHLLRKIQNQCHVQMIELPDPVPSDLLKQDQGALQGALTSDTASPNPGTTAEPRQVRSQTPSGNHQDRPDDLKKPFLADPSHQVHTAKPDPMLLGKRNKGVVSNGEHILRGDKSIDSDPDDCATDTSSERSSVQGGDEDMADGRGHRKHMVNPKENLRNAPGMMVQERHQRPETVDVGVQAALPDPRTSNGDKRMPCTQVCSRDDEDMQSLPYGFEDVPEIVGLCLPSWEQSKVRTGSRRVKTWIQAKKSFDDFMEKNARDLRNVNDSAVAVETTNVAKAADDRPACSKLEIKSLDKASGEVDLPHFDPDASTKDCKENSTIPHNLKETNNGKEVGQEAGRSTTYLQAPSKLLQQIRHYNTVIRSAYLNHRSPGELSDDMQHSQAIEQGQNAKYNSDFRKSDFDSCTGLFYASQQVTKENQQISEQSAKDEVHDKRALQNTISILEKSSETEINHAKADSSGNERVSISSDKCDGVPSVTLPTAPAFGEHTVCPPKSSDSHKTMSDEPRDPIDEKSDSVPSNAKDSRPPPTRKQRGKQRIKEHVFAMSTLGVLMSHQELNSAVNEPTCGSQSKGGSTKGSGVQEHLQHNCFSSKQQQNDTKSEAAIPKEKDTTGEDLTVKKQVEIDSEQGSDDHKEDNEREEADDPVWALFKGFIKETAERQNAEGDGGSEMGKEESSSSGRDSDDSSPYSEGTEDEEDDSGEEGVEDEVGHEWEDEIKDADYLVEEEWDDEEEDSTGKLEKDSQRRKCAYGGETRQHSASYEYYEHGGHSWGAFGVNNDHDYYGNFVSSNPGYSSSSYYVQSCDPAQKDSQCYTAAQPNYMSDQQWCVSPSGIYYPGTNGFKYQGWWDRMNGSNHYEWYPQSNSTQMSPFTYDWNSHLYR